LKTCSTGDWLPTIRAAIELNRKRPEKAVELLQAASGYDAAIANDLLDCQKSNTVNHLQVPAKPGRLCCSIGDA
jgi:hypothetical protein